MCDPGNGGWQSKNASGERVQSRGEGACADLMTVNQGNSFTQQNGKGIPQFAPNFTVYVLPPNVVCLYSEDRKFLLHGELYCALASAIAKGGKSFGELVRELEPDFPSDKIHEALTRLLDRRYVIPTSRYSNGASAAYCAAVPAIRPRPTPKLTVTTIEEPRDRRHLR